MAANLKDNNERIRRMLMVYDYVQRTHSSTRKTAKYFSDNFFSISNATVLDYLKRVAKLYKDKGDEIEIILNENKVESIESEEIKDRVINAASLIMEGNKVDDISITLGVSYFTIYRDLTIRLEKIDIDLYNQVKLKMEENRLNNLKDSKIEK